MQEPPAAAAEAHVTITIGDWTQMKPMCEPCRINVFVKEQGIPMEIEFDDRDATALHFVAESRQAEEESLVLGTARLLPDGHIGRVCVLKQARDKGVGRQLILAVMNMAKAMKLRGEIEHEYLVLESQVQAKQFYAKLGFVENTARGIFPVSRLPHVEMKQAL